ncbi:MAG: NUDIX domain-containing protein [Candidatus Moranbacteria bacterium]|nr:NUDIX domain-containing protein [Candidatus Moranbacteria bacterium]
MKLLKVIKHCELFPPCQSKDGGDIEIRNAARAVVFDGENKIAILHVSKHGYHKLPGGGVEDGEDIEKALEREIKEEIGSQIEVTGEIGRIIEHKDAQNLKQQSFCWLAKLVRKKGQSDFTEEELGDGFGVMWVSLDEAIEIIKNDQPNNYDGKFIVIRDLCFLKEAKKYVLEKI